MVGKDTDTVYGFMGYVFLREDMKNKEWHCTLSQLSQLLKET